MVTGLFGPQTDIDRLPNWGRNLTTTGEDPYLSGQMVAAQINGIQGVGAMSQMKHFAVYNGQNQNTNTDISDQALHQIYLTPYEAGFVDARRRGDDVLLPDLAGHLDHAAVDGIRAVQHFSAESVCQRARPRRPGRSTSPTSPASSRSRSPTRCVTSGVRRRWSAPTTRPRTAPSAIFQGEDQEQPTTNGYFSDSNSSAPARRGFFGPPSAFDPTGNICADASGNAESCSAAGAIHVAGIPGPGCPATGCTLVQAVANGSVPLSVFNQALATMLYQEQRFGMLGCDQTPVAATCTNPGGINGDTTGIAPLPTGPAHGATPTADLGTKNGDAAVVEKMSEEGAVLLKNDSSDPAHHPQPTCRAASWLPGPGAEYTIADPTSEASLGFADRDAINPLEQLKAFSGNAGRVHLRARPRRRASRSRPRRCPTRPRSVTGHLDRTTGPGSPTTDSSLDFTTVSGNGQLAPGNYTWTGYVYVPSDRHLHLPVPVQQRACPAPT